MDELKETLVQDMQNAIGSRHYAADILRKVAEDGQAGCFPSDMSCAELGKALYRICMNSQEKDPLFEIIKAWRACERKERDDFLRHYHTILCQRDALMKETHRTVPPFVE